MWHSPAPMRPVVALVAASTVLFSTRAASAAGFYLSDIGTRGMGRAGAFVASPDSLLAIHYNPAGLSHLQGVNAEASVTFVNMNVDFSRKCPCLIDRSDLQGMTADQWDAQLEASFDQNPVSSNSLLVIPFIGASYGLPFYDLTIGLAAWGPNSGRHDWGELPPTTSPRFDRDVTSQPNRYSGMRMGNIEANFALAVAAQPIDGLRIGASLIGYQSGNNQTLHLWANSDLLGIQQPEDPDFDAPVAFRFDDFALNWSVGASYEIISGLSIGTSFRAKRNISADGTIDVQIPRAVVDADPPALEVEGNQVKVDLATAPIWRAGIQYRIPRVFAAEAAFVYEAWGVHDRVVIRPQNINLLIFGNPAQLDDIVAERNWKNTYSLRLGGEVNVLDPILNVVGGYFYEPTGIAPENVDPSRTDFDKHGMSLGARTTFFGFTLDASFMYVALKSTQVRNSTKVLTGALEGEREEYLTHVGNGDYSGGYYMISTSLSFALDPFLGLL